MVLSRTIDFAWHDDDDAIVMMMMSTGRILALTFKEFGQQPGTDAQAEISGSALEATMDPFTGTWIANIAKSQRRANHQVHSAKRQFNVTGNAIAPTQSGVNGRGTYEVARDGRTLTATVSGIDAGGKAFDQAIVFDRAQDGRA